MNKNAYSCCTMTCVALVSDAVALVSSSDTCILVVNYVCYVFVCYGFFYVCMYRAIAQVWAIALQNAVDALLVSNGEFLISCSVLLMVPFIFSTPSCGTAHNTTLRHVLQTAASLLTYPYFCLFTGFLHWFLDRTHCVVWVVFVVQTMNFEAQPASHALL